MHVKVLFAALALVCAAQAAPANFEIEPIDVLGDVFEKIKQFLEKVSEEVADLDDKVTATIDSIDKRVREETRKQSAKFQEQVQQAADASVGYGVDIRECVAGDNKFQPIFEDAADDARKCLANEMKTLNRVQEDAQEIIRDTQKLVQKAQDALDECNKLGLVGNALCRADAAFKRSIEFAELSAKAAGKMFRGATAVIASQAKINSCITDSFFEHAEEANDVLKSTLSCIKEKVSEAGQHPDSRPTTPARPNTPDSIPDMPFFL